MPSATFDVVLIPGYCNADLLQVVVIVLARRRLACRRTCMLRKVRAQNRDTL